MPDSLDAHRNLASRLAVEFATFEEVEAIALGGSLTAGSADPTSDIDLYVFTHSVIPLEKRAALVQKIGASRADLNLMYWDLGDEWFDASTGIEVDMIYWDCGWFEEQINRVLAQHQPAMGYTTSFWHTLNRAEVLFDRRGWLADFKRQAAQPYPEELRTAIIRLNHPLLRSIIPAYLHQIEKAVQRKDLVSVNHRVAALLASYFDILFALNRVLHPGEKRLVQKAQTLCPLLPEGFAEQIEAVLRSTVNGDEALVSNTNTLLDSLDALLLKEGFGR